MQLEHGRVGDAIAFLDNGLLNTTGVGTTYVVQGDDIAIVETGTSLCAGTILEGLRALDVQPRDVRHILLTHLHMDHAGGAGVLVEHMPEARVYLHSTSHQHLIDPGKLLPSAERALGDLFAAHGTLVPLLPEKLLPAETLDLDLGQGVRITAIPTPGHSPDHLAYHELSTGALFSGDSVGIELPRFGFYGPVTPPPSVDVEAQHATFQTLLALPIQHLLFSHCGPSSEPPHTVIRRLQQRFEQLDDLVRSAFERGAVDEDAIVNAMQPRHPVPEPGRWVIDGWVRMSIKGLVRYYTKRGEGQ